MCYLRRTCYCGHQTATPGEGSVPWKMPVMKAECPLLIPAIQKLKEINVNGKGSMGLITQLQVTFQTSPMKRHFLVFIINMGKNVP